MTTTNDLDRVRRDLATCREAMNNPRVGGITMRRLFAQYGSLLRQVDALEIDLAINHIEAMDHETEIATRATVYRNG